MIMTSIYPHGRERQGFFSAIYIISRTIAEIGEVWFGLTHQGTGYLAMAGRGKGAKKEKETGSERRGKKQGSGKAAQSQEPGGPESGDDEEAELEDEQGVDSEKESTTPAYSGEWSGPRSGKEDMELIERFLAGDQSAFTRLVVKYQHKVYNLCYRVLGDRDEAQDMAQEIFLTIHKSLRDFRGDSLFSTWMFRVTVNHCKNRIKYLGRRKYYHSLSLDQPHDTGEGEIYHEVVDEDPDPEAVLSSQEIQAVVQEAISTLDPDHRMAIVLRDIQDKSYEEIAEIVGIRVGTVKSRIHRARSELKKKLIHKLKP